MKAVSIIGYKNSGKTMLTCKIADELEARGKTVAIAKFSHSAFTKPEADTTYFMKEGRTVIGLNNEECNLYWGDKKMLPDLLPLAQADYLLIEGGKSLSWTPRVILLNEAGEQEALDRGLAIAAYGDIQAERVTTFNENSFDDLLDCIEEKAFMLPALDCGACGEKNCEVIAQKIVAGKATMKACKAIHESGLSIEVNGAPVGLNPFVENIIRGSIEGMLGSLKGYAPGGEVVLKIKG